MSTSPPLEDPGPAPRSGAAADHDTTPAPCGPADSPPPAHPPIRGLRVMAVVRWALLALVTVLAGYNVVTLWGPTSSAQSPARPDRYYCAMHPQIRSADPGTCPICHMDLEPIPADRQQGTSQSPPASPHAGHGTMGGAAGTGEEPAPTASAPPGLVPVTLSLDRQQLIGIATAPVVKGPLETRLRVPGNIEAPQSGISEVRVRAAGFIESVSVRETGVRVRRGQALAFMFSPDIYRAQEELLAANRFASDPLAAAAAGKTATDMASAARRALELLGLSTSDIDAVIRSGKASRTVAIRAPAAGIVTKFYGVLGTRAMPEAPLYEIADLSRVWVIASLHERDLPHVKTGMVAQFTPSGRPEAVRSAKVELVEPDVSRATRTVRVRLSLENKDYELRPGQYGEVAFELPGEASLLVARDAVIDTGKVQYVFVALEGGQFEPRVVGTGALAGDRLQITSGLKEGDQVVSRGSFLIDSESRLRAALLTAPSAPPAATAADSGAPAAPGR